MTEYMIGVFVIAAALGVMRLLGYRSGNMEKLALGIICLYVIISPLRSLLDLNFDGFWDIPEIETEDGSAAVLEDAMAEGIARAVVEEFSLRRGDVSVRLFGFDKEVMTADKIKIILSGGAVTADYRGIESFVNKMNIGECKVEISF